MRCATRFELGTYATKIIIWYQSKYFQCKSQLEKETAKLSHCNLTVLYRSVQDLSSRWISALAPRNNNIILCGWNVTPWTFANYLSVSWSGSGMTWRINRKTCEFTLPLGSKICVVCHNWFLYGYFILFLLSVRWQLWGRVPNTREVRHTSLGLQGLAHCHMSQCTYHKQTFDVRRRCCSNF
jgi:hypothetical protein